MEIEEVLDDAIKGSFLLTMPTGAPEQGLPPTTARATFVAARNSPPNDGLFSPFMLCVAEWTP